MQHTVLLDEQGVQVTHAGLWQRARAVAAGLQHGGLEPGQSVALMLPTDPAFFEAFAGILLAGGVPVPIYPPLRATQVEDHLRRQSRILENAGEVLLVTDARAMGAARLLKAGLPALRDVTTVERLAASGGRLEPARPHAQDVALLQYTSGSTGQPKGVVLTHANLLANIRAMGRALRADPADVFVSWLPLYHDMGLIGAWLATTYHGVPLVVMPPQRFLARPSRWLLAISEHGGTLSAAPNFAYEILATRVPDDELRGLDLGRWRAALNGAEPVHAGTLERFAARFARHGFDTKALMPVYGLAECGVGLAFPPLGRGPKVDRIDRDALRDRGEARPVGAAGAPPPPAGAEGAGAATPSGRETRSGTTPAAMPVVSCGLPLAGHEIRIVDEQGEELPDRHEGRVEFRGPSATSGYLRNPEATQALRRHVDWLDTGDVGYVAEGELYLTSRVKDLIIRGGHNLHPYDLESAVGELPGVRRGCVAVFGARDRAGETERVVVLAETRLADAGARAALRERIAALSVERLGAPADDIVLAAPHTVLKTSSGKIRRAACRELYERGDLGAATRPVAWQVASLWRDAARRRVREWPQLAARAWEGGWPWAVFALGAAVATAVALLPSRPRRKRAGRAIARALLAASGIPVTVSGEEHLATRPAVFAANHASYVDWLLLTAVLPAEACIVAKRELSDSPPLRWVLTRYGVRFVDREAVADRVEGARRLTEAARAGESLAYFPEGTLSRAPGLKPFRLGAFAAAAEAGLPVVPVSVAGTRSVMRDGRWWPRRLPVRVRVHAPIRPTGTAFAEVLRLRDATRERIGSACGEPMLPS